jgi:hypothetical protein
VPTLLHRTRPVALSAQELKVLWQQLGSSDAALAYEAQGRLLLQPEQAIALLRSRLARIAPPDPEKLKRLLGDLESTTFSTRQRAMAELEQLDDLAEPALRQALAGKPTLETRRRLEVLLAKATGLVARPETLRALRAVEVLQSLGTPEARALLETMSKGAPQSRITRAARN